MLLRNLELTSALRPSLSADETLLFVQDVVGLYHGKDKLPDFQDGQVYLTTHRVCYVDRESPSEKSAVIDLKEVDRCEYVAGFFKSSPKVVLVAKASGGSSLTDRYSSLPTQSTSRGSSLPVATAASTYSGPDSDDRPRLLPHIQGAGIVTWTCPICMFSNTLPPTLNASTITPTSSIPPCEDCGVKPSFTHILKAAIAGASGRQVTPKTATSAASEGPSIRHQISNGHRGDVGPGSESSSDLQACPQCTYLNHPAMTSCEICGASLESSAGPQYGMNAVEHYSLGSSPLHTPAPPQTVGKDFEILKYSFRAGGDKVFYDKLKGTLVQRKWLLHAAPPIPDPVVAPAVDQNGGFMTSEPIMQKPVDSGRFAGIAELERRGLDVRKKNEEMIGSAFEDLAALMASAKEIIALAESFAKNNDSPANADPGQLIVDSARQLDMVTTKDMLGRGAGNESLYLAELSRHLAEYLTDDARGSLEKEGGIMTLVDLWAVFNHTRGGVELVSPSDFEKAAALWEKLKLPVRLRKFGTGLLVVQQADRTDDKTIAQLLDWLQDSHFDATTSDSPPTPHQELFGRGVTAQKVATHFGWSIGVATEELAMAEEKGALCRESGVEGLKYWENWLIDYEDDVGADIVVTGHQMLRDNEDEIVQGLRATGLL